MFSRGLFGWVIVGFFSLVSISGLNAQQLHYSELESFDFRNSDYAVVGNIGEQYYAYRGSEEGHFLDLFDKEMVKQATVILDFISGRVQRIRFYIRGEQIMVLYQQSEGRHQVAYSARLDLYGRIQGRPLRITSVEGRLLGGSKASFYTAVSENREHVVVYQPEGGQDFQLNAYWIHWDTHAVARQSRQWEGGGDLELGAGMVSNTGEFYLPVYTSVRNTGLADQLWLLKLKAEGDLRRNSVLAENEVIAIPLDRQLAAGTYMKMDNARDRVFVAGFYAEKRNGNLEGVMSCLVESNGVSMGVKKMRFLPFDEPIRLATGDRRSRKALNQFQVRDLIVKNDGGFVLIAEDYFISTRHGYSPGFGYYSWYYPSMANSVREYHYGDILVISYDGSGDRDWFQFIRKDQYTQEDGGLFSSFLFVNTGGAIGFLFNDFMGSRSRIRMTSLDGQGQGQTQILGKESQKSPDWIPRFGEQISAREVMVPCLVRRKICFAKLTL